MIPTLAAGSVVSWLVAAGNAAAGGPDYIGIAAVITAATGGFATVVMAVLALIRYLKAGDPPTAEDIGEAVKKAISEAGE